MFLHE